MPGDNCSVFGCGTSRRTKGVGIWKLPAPKDEGHRKWRDAWLSEITKTRTVDAVFRKKIQNDTIYTCEKHFHPQDVEIFQSEKMIKKKPRFGALPLLNMPKRSHETNKPVPRPARSVVTTESAKPGKSAFYKTFGDLCKRVPSLKSLNEWNIQTSKDRLVITKMKDNLLLPEKELIVDDSLGFTIKVFGCFLPETHDIYIKHLRSLNVPVSNIVKEMDSYSLCAGIGSPCSGSQMSSIPVHHVIPIQVDPLAMDNHQMFPHEEYWRSNECLLMCKETERCN